MSILLDLSPADVGLPAKFPAFRKEQAQAIEQVVYSSKRFQALALPTGTGKSLTALAIAKILNLRTVILTSNHGLADQYVSDFTRVHSAVSSFMSRFAAGNGTTSTQPWEKDDLICDVRGKANYHCSHFHHLNCDDGMRTGCPASGSMVCGYHSALTRARNWLIDSTNYKFWFHVNRGGVGLERVIKPNPIELLILDEAHLAPGELADFLSITITEKEIQEQLGTIPPMSTANAYTDDIETWRKWAKGQVKDLELEYGAWSSKVLAKGAAAQRKELDLLRHLEGLLFRLQRLAKTEENGWVCEQFDPYHARSRRWQFDPIWPGLFAESTLFRSIPKVLLISATIMPKTMSLLGVGEGDYEFNQWERVFPANRSPVYHLLSNPPLRMNWRTSPQDYDRWLDKIDSIIQSRPDRKGIIHTVSYDRQQLILSRSQFAQYMLANTKDVGSPKAAQVVHQFKTADPPCILVSPSFATGWDFPGEECEWMIITKLPFPDMKSKVMKERRARDPKYLDYLTMQELVQMCGRGMRSVKDQCEVFVVDDSISWFLWQNKRLTPKWFGVHVCAALPAPLPALATQNGKYA